MLAGCRGGSARTVPKLEGAPQHVRNNYHSNVSATQAQAILRPTSGVDYVRLWVSAIGAAPIQSRLPAGLWLISNAEDIYTD